MPATEPVEPGPTAGIIERELMRLVRAGHRVHRRMQAAGDAPEQLERAAYQLLAHIVESGEVRLTALAELACVDTSTVSRQVSHLEAQGLVARTTDTADRRAVLLRATDEGVDLLTRTRAARGRFIAAVVADWPAADCKDFGRLLTRFNDGVARWTSIRQETS
ncbi:MAG: MarR family winged helix-turn-helix transcriptional regulator [Actinomycetota bacterium]|nr:MarR family winged helix-turn-helix transcriptional regulator [Actinomycetota bacterium]